MDIEQVINKFGGLAKLAKAIGVTIQTTSSWRRRKNIPWYWEDRINEAYKKINPTD
jgi:hypothetical protein